MNAWAYQTGTSGTCVVPVGCVLTHVIAESRAANGSVAIFGGSTTLLDGTTQLLWTLAFPVTQDPTRPNELIAPQSVAGATDIVFANTVSYFVGYVRR